MKSGLRAGSNYVLDENSANRIGRGLDCEIVVTDPLSSRVHALILWDQDAWWVRDAGSRNGTYLDGQKIDEVRLTDGCTIRIGNDEFAFHFGEPSAAVAGHSNPSTMQTIVLDKPVAAFATGQFLLSGQFSETDAQDLLDLYQLSITLLGCSVPQSVIQSCLEVLKDKTKASVAGFLWLSDGGELKPQFVVPTAKDGHIRLSRTLTELVVQRRHAVWASDQGEIGAADSVRHFADAICVPLINQEHVLGAVHLYLEHSHYRQRDFEFALSVGNLLSVALEKTRRIARLQEDHRRLAAQTGVFDELIGECQAMRDLKNRILRIAKASGCVLIRGESGSGKELVARAIHRISPRADRPMLSVNCAAIPRDLMESQLFGHRKGAFTGADNDHTGWFQQADAGTLFLDEIGELTLEGQAKLLRILEGHPFLPVGATREVCVDVRVLAATNRDLREFVREGRFREDLYYRLSVFELNVPPLRERGEDISQLVDHFFQHFRQQHGRLQLELSSAARAKLLSYQWPGNVRQLRNVIDSGIVMAEDPEVQPDDLGLRGAVSGGWDTLRLDEWERRLILEALGRTRGNIPEAAQLLGIARATLYRKVDDYGLKRDSGGRSASEGLSRGH
ncbi:MAG: sigma 54-interacting transcriptional regulator [Pirellulaceae bacterium]